MVLFTELYSHNKNIQIPKIEQNVNNKLLSKIVVFVDDQTQNLISNSKVFKINKKFSSVQDKFHFCNSFVNSDICVISNDVLDSSLINLISHNFKSKIIQVNQNTFIFRSDSTNNRPFLNVESNDKIINTTSNITNSKESPTKLNLQLPNKVLKDVSSKLDVFIVSVNYSDYLSITLSNNVNYLSNIHVITSSTDYSCHEICQQFNVDCIITDKFYENSDPFNKARALNYAISTIPDLSWILILDADIILPQKIDTSILNSNVLYSCKRKMIKDKEEYDSILNGFGGNFKVENYIGFGYFQLFNINSEYLDGKFFSENYKNASTYDVIFKKKFNQVEDLNFQVLHLGPTRVNWNGRVSKEFDNRVQQSVLLKQSKYGKLNINKPVIINYHNGGWSNCLNELEKINNSNGILFDTFLENTFSWKRNQNLKYQDRWIGLLHFPLNFNENFRRTTGNIEIFKSKNFIESLPYCKGLYVFSDFEKENVMSKLYELGFVDIPVDCLKHTTPKKINKWSIDKFENDKKILHIGWWLRDIESFYTIKLSLSKIRLRLNQVIERKIKDLFSINNKDVTEIDSVSNEQYDEFLCSSIVYLKTYDGVAINTLLECIETHTPIIVNRQPSTEFYLGKDYPLFFDEENNVEALIENEKLIEASEYLKHLPKSKDLGRQIEISEIYKNINSDFSVETFFLPGDLPNSNGGIYNPGFVVLDSNKYMILRVENYTEKQRGINDLWKKTSAIPHLIKFDDNQRIISSTELKVVGEYLRIEDFRLFVFNNQLYSNHILVDKYGGIYPVISKIDTINNQLIILGRIHLNDLQLNKVEKNWTFFEKDEKLLLLYSLQPFRIFEVNLDIMSANLIYQKENKYDWQIQGFLSLSTNPIKITDNKWLVGIHTRDRKLVYHQGLLIFNDNFELVKCSKSAYISGGDFDSINDGVIYTSSIYFDQNKQELICYAGDGDFKTIAINIKNDFIWKELL